MRPEIRTVRIVSLDPYLPLNSRTEWLEMHAVSADGKFDPLRAHSDDPMVQDTLYIANLRAGYVTVETIDDPLGRRIVSVEEVQRVA